MFKKRIISERSKIMFCKGKEYKGYPKNKYYGF